MYSHPFLFEPENNPISLCLLFLNHHIGPSFYSTNSLIFLPLKFNTHLETECIFQV
ncbi:hypothetical protein P872_12035 [Rhodonellum psychrophilum GCM71 = DSM 17998]|uniref:Uncharacterized protein n=1 Tax=Rhodonellum psychrophilum GCM71 = DSM 17998 TaxID=1123057 RepID=U5BKL9_9BACT|nr:hypothetical protein P872_12035 [Rhodonellum psychrophilum GCM71 = DSM 17998]